MKRQDTYNEELIGADKKATDAGTAGATLDFADELGDMAPALLSSKLPSSWETFRLEAMFILRGWWTC